LTIVQSRLRPSDQSSGIKVVKEYAQLDQVSCYPAQLNQVFLNLLNNAIDALNEADRKRTPEEIVAACNTTWIRTCLNAAQQIEISIADNGVGITDSIFTRLFDPFFTTKDVGKGSGLGLTISYQIVTELHQGRLDCNSNLGKGAEFIVTLPT
jgi:two-component system, NtrC family, sensor kinase